METVKEVTLRVLREQADMLASKAERLEVRLTAAKVQLSETERMIERIESVPDDLAPTLT